MAGEVKQVNDNMEILVSKTEVRELERELDNITLLEVREKKFCLRLRVSQGILMKISEKTLLNLWQFFLIGGRY